MRVEGSSFRIQGPGFRVWWDTPIRGGGGTCGLRVEGLRSGFRVKVGGLRVEGLAWRV